MALGIPVTTLKRYTNLSLFPILSPTLGVLIIPVDPSIPMSERSPVFAGTPAGPISGVNLLSIAYGVLATLAMDKVTLLGTFNSPGDAAKTEGKEDNKYIRRYINLERPV